MCVCVCGQGERVSQFCLLGQPNPPHRRLHHWFPFKCYDHHQLPFAEPWFRHIQEHQKSQTQADGNRTWSATNISVVNADCARDSTSDPLGRHRLQSLADEEKRRKKRKWRTKNIVSSSSSSSSISIGPVLPATGCFCSRPGMDHNLAEN